MVATSLFGMIVEEVRRGLKFVNGGMCSASSEEDVHCFYIDPAS
jgi:hypothetical protein